ncbi:MAG TPA: NAD-dependent succinate-semialdehyde dehydrogenase [Spongiibacteraceae bacterium]|nr:NAD-dependent succinate-semialdehyde dehydrogenase [Spongiibacteraceae bacterium]
MQLNDSSLLKNQALIGGSWVGAASGKSIPVTDPANGEQLATIPSLSAEEIEQVIAISERAQVQWRKLAAKERAQILRRWFDLIIANADDIAMIMTREQGKPLPEARGEVLYAASFIEWFSEEAKRIYGDVIPHPQADKRITVFKQPIGVTAAITPWNFPAAMITRKAGAALAAGCSMIVRPAQATPLTALALGELAVRAGVPAGVLQIVSGPSSVIGGVLTSSPVVRKLSFTGSTEVGRLLMAQCAPTIKRLSLELGGNAPFIVFEDADIEAAVEGALAAKYRNSGQTCVCVNRIYVQDRIYDKFAEVFAKRVSEMKVGNGVEAGTMIGPLIDEESLLKVQELVDDAKSKGAKIITGGDRHALGGTFYQPTVIAGATTSMRFAREEIFGPVAPLFRFSDEDDVVAMANDTEFGLAAYFYTRDLSRAWRVAEALEYGMVGLNTGLISNEVAPFGGVKQSGVGREGSHYGIDEYLDIKYLCTQL